MQSSFGDEVIGEEFVVMAVFETHKLQVFELPVSKGEKNRLNNLDLGCVYYDNMIHKNAIIFNNGPDGIHFNVTLESYDCFLNTVGKGRVLESSSDESSSSFSSVKIPVKVQPDHGALASKEERVVSVSFQPESALPVKGWRKEYHASPRRDYELNYRVTA